MKSLTLNKEIISGTENNLFLINDLFYQISQAEKKTKILVDNLRKESDKIEDRITPLNNLYFEGHDLLKAPRFTQGALSEKPSIKRRLENVNNFRVNELPSLKEKIQNEPDSYKSLQKLIFQKLGETRLSVKNTQERFEYLNKSIEKRRFISTIQWSAIYIVIVAVVITIGYYLYKKIILRKQSFLDSNNLETLLAQIKDTKEFFTIRLEAIKLIYEYQNNFNIDKLESLVKRLKDTVKQMEKFKYDDDIKVIGELRKVTESLELRLMEKRSFK